MQPTTCHAPERTAPYALRLQIGLYPLAPLAESGDSAAEHEQPLPGCLGSSSSSQRSERTQQTQQQQAVPLLAPVATVRLPGKVSSIAFSPDMQGVISIGDYDGTLTQVGRRLHLQMQNSSGCVTALCCLGDAQGSCI